jgi:hypothetical protein
LLKEIADLKEENGKLHKENYELLSKLDIIPFLKIGYISPA